MAENWSPGPILAAKIGPGEPILAAKIGPTCQKWSPMPESSYLVGACDVTQNVFG